MYMKLALEYLNAAGAQSSSYLGKTYGLPPGASGTNTLQGLIGYLGFGLFLPIRYGIYGHGGLDIGLGSVWQRTLYFSTIGVPGSLTETDPSLGHVCYSFGLKVGLAIKLSDYLSLDVQTGLDYRMLNALSTSNDGAGNISIPISIFLAYPF